MVKLVRNARTSLWPVRIGIRGFTMSSVMRKNEVHWTPNPTVDRELPDPFAKRKLNFRYMTIYGVGIVAALLMIFNYEKTTSPLLNSTMYFLRKSTIAKDELGDYIAFASSWPWIWGTLNAVKGDMDISFKVAGSKGQGTVFLKAQRVSKIHPFDIQKFALVVNGVLHDLTQDPVVDFNI